MKFPRKLILWWVKRPGFSLTATFLLLIILGTILLSLPISSSDGRRISFVNALFTATSATCVTGLVVVDTGMVFSLFGQFIIMLLIQFGAINMIVASIFFILLLGRKISLANQVSAKIIFDVDFINQAEKLIFFTTFFTFLAEFAGTAVLFFRWHNLFPSGWTGLFYSLFHSISAFGNAGFSLFSNNLMNYRGDVLVNAVICSLIIFGGLGFVVLKNLGDFIRSFKSGRTEKRYLSLHTRIVLVTTLILVLGGALFFYFTEHFHSFGSFSFQEKVLASIFQSVTARTAGFNTVDIGALSAPSQIVLMFLMFVGGAPGGTAGGVKITATAILLLMFVSVIRGKQEVIVNKRKISNDNLFKATTLVVAAMVIVFLFTTALSFTEKAPFKEILFETISAFGTVGLSCGLTSYLSTAGKILIALLMLIGRIGPLNLVLLLNKSQGTSKISYPSEKILIG